MLFLYYYWNLLCWMTKADERSQREILFAWCADFEKQMSLKCHRLRKLRRIKQNHIQQIVIFTQNHHAQSILIPVRLQKKSVWETLLFHISWFLSILFICMMKFHTAIFLFSSTLLPFTFFFLSLLLCNSLPVEKKKRREKKRKICIYINEYARTHGAV